MAMARNQLESEGGNRICSLVVWSLAAIKYPNDKWLFNISITVYRGRRKAYGRAQKCILKAVSSALEFPTSITPLMTAPYRNLLAIISISLLLSSGLNVYNLYELRTRGEFFELPTRYLLIFDFFVIIPGSTQAEPVASELPMTVNHAVLNFLFAQHYEITNDSEWATLIPSKGGRVHLPSTERPPSSGNNFEVALYHDLHCLDVIRSVFVSMRDGSSAYSPEAEECLGTIRQATLCTADITLEPAKLICYDGDTCNDVGPEASGNNVDHSCRDWVQVREFVESNQRGWDI
ncbi:hypothetical protein J3R30DRAFT_618101 [Lentinula aciculospora]|uniref:Uncharacterized protein n=1 Tax=Lentinula aciculospora TaxID=153920 RepID=A0A9W9A7Z1_9AGAR|nr:hypothetical protein J3R30DRAFT_618101 [Lentinula aciculospora]